MGKYRNPYKRYGKNAAAAKESKSAVSRLILRIVNILPSGPRFCRAAPLIRAYVILFYCTIFFRTSQQGAVTFKTKNKPSPQGEGLKITPFHLSVRSVLNACHRQAAPLKGKALSAQKKVSAKPVGFSGIPLRRPLYHFNPFTYPCTIHIPRNSLSCPQTPAQWCRTVRGCVWPCGCAPQFSAAPG